MMLYAFHQGHGGDLPPNDKLWYSVYLNGEGWQPDTQVPDVGMSESPSPVIWNGVLHVFYQGYDFSPPFTEGGNGKLEFFWESVHQVPNVGMSGSPSAVQYGADLYVFHQGSGEDGQLWYSAYLNGKGWQPDTQLPNVGMSESPSAVVWNGRLHVFFQGGSEDGQLWFVYFDGTNWQPVQQVPDVGMSKSPAMLATT